MYKKKGKEGWGGGGCRGALRKVGEINYYNLRNFSKFLVLGSLCSSSYTRDTVILKTYLNILALHRGATLNRNTKINCL